ncbi:dCTP deaminase, partial [Candidatus Micrarchaeota archaeon]|nr:dCTP deaminase [Candidatus Micrarchaeota archaeon]
QKGKLVVKPFDETCLQPASIDLKLSDEFRVFKHTNHALIDIKQNFGEYTEQIKIKKEESFVLHPDEFVLGSTLEWVEVPDYLVGRLEGKSSLGRLGIITHATAGFVDPGFKGRLTLEISNVGKIPVSLYPGMKIAQFSIIRLTTPVDTPYGSDKLHSKYQGQHGPEESKIHKNYHSAADTSTTTK